MPELMRPYADPNGVAIRFDNGSTLTNENTDGLTNGRVNSGSSSLVLDAPKPVDNPELILLETLDFEPECFFEGCSEAADWVLTCRTCPRSFLWCASHLARARAFTCKIGCARCFTSAWTAEGVFDIRPCREGLAS